MVEQKHNLEYCIELAHEYNQKPMIVIRKHAEIFKSLLQQYPQMGKEWYHYETERRTKIYYKEEQNNALPHI